MIASRVGHTSIFIADSKTLLVFGGYRPESDVLYNDLWAFSFINGTWSRISRENATENSAGSYTAYLEWNNTVYPSSRAQHAMIFDWRLNVSVILGGWGYDAYGRLGKLRMFVGAICF